ncbi:MAG: hypothetical protein AAFO91_19245, partial [Bacteroidota bacterium]
MSTLPVTVLPSFPAPDWQSIRTLVTNLQGAASEIQVDMVDGHFASPASWPFTESDPRLALDALKSLRGQIAVEVDCMLMHPEQYLDLFVELGVVRVLVHFGTTERFDEIQAHSMQYGYEVGIAFTNDTPLPSTAIPITCTKRTRSSITA